MHFRPSSSCFAPLGTTLLLICFSLVLLAVSCKPGTSSSGMAPADSVPAAVQGPLPLDPEKVLLGEWVNKWLHVELTTAGGSPLERVVDVREEDWFQTFKRTPLHTFYKADHTYYWEYIEKDSLITGPVGTWQVVGDTIVHADTTYADNNFHYKLIIHSDSLIEYRTDVDWDYDGAKDDKYYAKMRRARAGE